MPDRRTLIAMGLGSSGLRRSRDDWLRWRAIKALGDGSLGSRTAVFREPYTDAPGQTGVRVTSLADLREWIGGADAAGLHVAGHAIGDRMNDEILDIYADERRAVKRIGEARLKGTFVDGQEGYTG